MTDAVKKDRYDRMIKLLSGDAASPWIKLSMIVYSRDTGVIDQKEAVKLAKDYLGM